MRSEAEIRRELIVCKDKRDSNDYEEEWEQLDIEIDVLEWVLNSAEK